MKGSMWMVGMLVGFLGTREAAAQRPLTATEAEATRLNQRALQVFSSDPAQAAELYLAAYGVNPDCQAHFNAGVAYERAGNLESAAAQYRQYLNDLDRGGPTCQAPTGHRARDTMRALRARLENESLPRLDQEIAARRALARPPQSAAPASVPPPHPLPITVAAPSSGAAVSPPRAVLAPTPTYANVPAARWPGYAAWITGGLMMGWGVYSFVEYAVASGNAPSSNDPDPTSDEVRWQRARDSAALWGGVSLGVGAAFIAGGFLWSRFAPSHRVRVSFAPTVDRLGAAASIRF